MNLRNWVSWDSITLLFATLIGGVGLWVFITPGEPEFLTNTVGVVVEHLSVLTIAIMLSLLLAVVAVMRILFEPPTLVDRSPIVTTPPEIPSETGVPESVGPLNRIMYETTGEFEHPDEITRQVAMYGRELQSQSEEIPEPITKLFDELAVTARDTYRTGRSCDQETAHDAIEKGYWTNDRVASAFLATDVEEAPRFTVVERLTAWVAPERVFERRVERVVGAIEDEATVYLTFDPMEERQLVMEGAYE